MPHKNLNYEFGPYRFDLTQRILSRNGETIFLTPKATEILAMLVTNAGHVVEKDELLREVWPDTFVEEGNLTQNIFTLRRALGDEPGGPKFIETVKRRGYRFIANVRAINDQGEPADGLPAMAPTEASRIVIAVLPFLNSTGNPELEYLAEGVTDNLINNLSRVSRLHVMSRSTVRRYRQPNSHPQQAGREMGASAVLVGSVHSRQSAIAINVELVDVSTGWQLWGESFDLDGKDVLAIQDAITRQLLANLKLKLTGEEEKEVTARYTENADAYQSYLEGRYYWSRYTRKGIEKAISHFRKAIELDPNYALAYAAIVDCYLRLATNYLPPDDDVPSSESDPIVECEALAPDESDQRVRLRFEWDWKGVERELRRANELQTNYPSAHQWYAATNLSQQLWKTARQCSNANERSLARTKNVLDQLPTHIPSLELTPNEQVQVYCTIAREQIDAGNYDAACMILHSWWQFGRWPKLEALNQHSCADLLFTAGELAGCVASTRQLPKGQKHGEALLSGSIALWEQLGSRIRAAEGRIELALCYYRQGLFELGRSMLVGVLSDLSTEHDDLRSLALIRLASVERHAGRLHEALALLSEAAAILEPSGPWVRGRCNLELASTYKDLSISHEVDDYFSSSKEFHSKALHEFEAVGNHRLAAIVENNLGCLLLFMEKYSEAESHLLRARKSFNCFADKIRSAQADDSLARLYLAQGRLDQAELSIDRAVQTMEVGDEDALLAEALTTKGIIYCRSKRYNQAKRALEDAHRLASRCGDREGAGRALLVLIEEMRGLLPVDEQRAVGTRLVELLSSSQQPSLLRRLRSCVEDFSNQSGLLRKL